jgi:hypothetical protein
MGHLLEIKSVDSRVTVDILAATNVPFTLSTVQVPNLALTHKKRITVHLSKIQNGRQKQRSGQHTLGRQKELYKKLFKTRGSSKTTYSAFVRFPKMASCSMSDFVFAVCIPDLVSPHML